MRIELLDTGDDSAVERVIALRRAAHEADRPQDPAFCLGWERGRLLHPMPDERTEIWTASVGEELLGVLAVDFPELDNLGSGWFEVVVHPGARRRGVGAALFAHARARTEAAGRKLLIFETSEEGPPAAFAASLGAEVGIRDARRRLVCDPQTRELAASLLVRAAPHAGGYRVVSWRGATPEDMVEGIAYLNGRMSTDAPLENLEWEPEVYDAARLRRREAVYAARGARWYSTAVVHEATGEVAGFSELYLHPDDPTHAEQGNTIVDPRHRGHRLGAVVKVENLRLAGVHEPALRTVMTWNAASNTHMVGVNEAMGFRLWDHWIEWQVRL